MTSPVTATHRPSSPSPSPSQPHPPSSAPVTTSATSSGALPSGSLFTAKLHREIQKFPDVSWRNSFIDYQRLRKQIKKIVYYEQENKPINNNNNNDPAAATPPTNSNPPSLIAAPSIANRDRLRKSRDIFWCVLKAEIDKVNSFFSSKEDEMSRQLKLLDLERPEEEIEEQEKLLISENGFVKDRIIFAKLLIEQFPFQLTSRLVDEDTRMRVNEINWSSLSQYSLSRVSVIQHLLTICSLLDQLRKFVVLNYVVVLKVLKKYEEYTRRNAKQEFLAELEEEPFYSSNKLTILLNRAEKIAHRLLPQARNKTQNSSFNANNNSAAAATNNGGDFVKSEPFLDGGVGELCPICRGPLQNPVQVACDHRFCFDCIAKQTAAAEFRCPMCDAQQEFDSLDLGLESVFSKFAGVRLTDKETWPQINNINSNSHQQNLNDLVNNNNNNIQVKQEHSQHSSLLDVVGDSLYSSLLRSKNGFPQIEIPIKSDSDGLNGSDSSDDDSPTSSGVQPGLSGFSVSSSSKKDKGSCHQCKTTRDSKLLLCCTSKAEKGKRKRKCRKKYCAACLQRTYAQVMINMTKEEISHWQCPACIGVCTCAACQRRGKETALENVGLPPPLNIPAELLANDPWAYALHSSSTAASAAQQAAAQAAAAIAAQQQLLQAQAVMESQSQAMAMGGMDPTNPLHQLQHSLAILQSLASASATHQQQQQASIHGLTQSQLAAITAAANINPHHLQHQQAIAHLNAFNSLTNSHQQANEADSIAAIKAMQQFTAMQQQHQHHNNNNNHQQSAAVNNNNNNNNTNGNISSNDLLAAHAAAASSRERHRHQAQLFERDRLNEEARLSKLTAFNFQAPPQLFLSSAPGSPSLSPMINRPQSPLSPISPGSAAISPELRNRSISHNLHKIAANRNLSMSVPSKTRSLAQNDANTGSAGVMEEPILNHSNHSSNHHSASTSPSLSYNSSNNSHHSHSRLSPMPLSASELAYSHSVPGAAVLTAVGGDEMPSFHTGSVQYPQSVPSRTRTLAAGSGSRPRSSLGRRGLPSNSGGGGSGEANSPNDSNDNSPDLPPPPHHYQQHSQLQSMSSRNPNKSLQMQNSHHQQIHHQPINSVGNSHHSPHQTNHQQQQSSSQRQSPASNNRRASFNNEFEDEAAAAAKRQQMELEVAYRLQMQLLALHTGGGNQPNNNNNTNNNNNNNNSMGQFHHSRANKSLNNNNSDLALQHQHALNALDNYSMQLQRPQSQQNNKQQQHGGGNHQNYEINQQQQHHHQHQQHQSSHSHSHSHDSSASSNSLHDSGLFDRQSSFQLPDQLPAFNPFVRDASMNFGPRGLSAVAMSGENENSSTNSMPSLTHEDSMEMAREMSAVNGLNFNNMPGFERGFSALMNNQSAANNEEEFHREFGGFSAAGQFDLERFPSSIGESLPMSLGLDRDLSALNNQSNNEQMHGGGQHTWRS